MSSQKAGPRVLVVDDDAAIIDVFSRVLSSAGYDVVRAGDGQEAQRYIDTSSFEVIVSDISMPGMNGVELLRAVRRHDADVPVILVTGEPDVHTAIQAVEYGALRYLLKPVDAKTLVNVVSMAVRLHELARLKRQAISVIREPGAAVFDRAGLEARFRDALDQVWMAYQPIVLPATRRVFAYEAFVRSRSDALPRPDLLLDAGERLNRLHELGRIIRAQVAETLPALDPDLALFVNVHPEELNDDELFDESAPLSRMARRVVLEVTERARLDPVPDLERRFETLRALGYRLAVDDLGAGYAGLSSFVQIRPEIVKIDMALSRGVENDPTRRNVIRSLLEVCRDLHIDVVIEGVETRDQSRVLQELGAGLLQGYFFAQPGEPFPPVADGVFS
jgi:EAL domain-containing protein (putative c-di-GMP-specific phosphodiesterase class I)/ActR/RegA family two-component response regulator